MNTQRVVNMTSNPAQQEPEPTELDKALILLYQFIEAVNGQGFFKQLAQLDQVREAYSTVTTEMQNLRENLQTLNHEIEQERSKNINRSEDSLKDKS